MSQNGPVMVPASAIKQIGHGKSCDLHSVGNDELKAMNLYKDTLHKIISQIGNKTTSNITLDRIGRKMFGSMYLGTFSCDKIPNKNGYCIANLDNQYQGGSHWVGICIRNNPKHDKKDVYIYDSFGRQTTKILPTLKLKNYHIYDADYDVEQDIKEMNCGQRSLSFLNVFDKLGKDYAMLI